MGYTRKQVWATELPGYQAVHQWIRAQLGTPLICQRCGDTTKTRRSYHWANKSQEYKRDISDWERLCVSCHFTVVDTEFKCGHPVDGNSFFNSASGKRQCRSCKNEANRNYRLRLKGEK